MFIQQVKDQKLYSLFSLHYYLEPLQLFGEGEYNLNSVKQMKVTESFLTLKKDDRKCQNTQDYEDCTTELYLDTLMEQCQCLPFNIKSDQAVN